MYTRLNRGLSAKPSIARDFFLNRMDIVVTDKGLVQLQSKARFKCCLALLLRKSIKARVAEVWAWPQEVFAGLQKGSVH